MYRGDNMLVESDRIIPITRLQKELTQTVRELSESGEPVYILKNNNMEAVMLTFDEYKHLSVLEEMFEYFEIKDVIDSRMQTYLINDSINWSDIKE
jgi:PHD/YefM family antitoxin component YafN of YafNO toxin-antitoxin module